MNSAGGATPMPAPTDTITTDAPPAAVLKSI